MKLAWDAAVFLAAIAYLEFALVQNIESPVICVILIAAAASRIAVVRRKAW